MHRRRSVARSRPFFALFRIFLGMLRGKGLIVAGALALLTISTLLVLIPPYGTKLIFDYALVGHTVPPHIRRWLPFAGDPQVLLAVVALITVAIHATSVLINVWSRWQMTKTAARMKVEIRRKVFDHTVQLPLHRVYELKSGGLTSILREDAGGVADLLFSMLYNPWRAIIQLAGTLIILVTLDWRLLVGGLALLPIVYFTHRTWIHRIRPMWRDVRASRTATDGHATEVFSGIRVVRGFSRQRTESSAFTRNNHLMARQEMHTWWWMRGIDTAWSLLMPTATALLVWYGGTRILQDQAQVAAGLLDPDKALTVGDLIMFMWYLASLLGPMATLAGSATGFQNNLAGLDRTLDLLQEPLEVEEKPGALHLRPAQVRGHLQLEHLGFTYPRSDTPVLTDITLDAPPGHVVALVGASGAGKTTLCNLVARFYDPTSGRIMLDGIDLRDIEVRSYRQLFGIVEQDVFLFDGSVAQNIAYSQRHTPLERIVQAARRANAHEFISQLPLGYDTNIGERGVRLSGGQRQRISIARAILADPRILVLDEATSNLDTQSEQLIQAALSELFANRTTFVIAHRLSTVTHADRIVVLGDGRVVETGSHSQLMARRGVYYDMVERQRQFSTVSDTLSEEPLAPSNA